MNPTSLRKLVRTGKIANRLAGSLVLMAFVAILALFGLFAPALVYPDDALAASFRANDAVNLIIVLPTLTIALFLRSTVFGFQLWAAALLAFAYNAFVPALSLPVGWSDAGQWLVFAISLSLAVRLVESSEVKGIAERLSGRVFERWTGGGLAAFGLAFALRAVWLFFSGDTLPDSELALLAADLVFGVFWLVGGVLLARKRDWGYVLGGIGLFHAALLFIALMVLLLLQPALAGLPLPVEDLVSIASMAAIFAIPVLLYWRGARPAGEDMKSE